MSNTGTLRQTEARQGGLPFSVSTLSTVAAAVLLTIVVVSLRPFQPAGGDAAASGDIVNQLGFGAIGALALLSMLCLADPRRVRALFSPWWLILLGFFVLSVMNALDPAAAMRAGIFTMIGIIAMCTVLVLAKDGDSLSTVLATMSLTVLGLSYFGVVAMPGIAIHSADSLEPQHAGLWRGLFSHKNVAGPVMANLSFVGFYLFRRGWRWIGGVIFVGAMVFILQTGSKTTAGLVPIAILVVALPSLMGLRRLTPLLFVLTLLVAAVATLGIVFIPPVKQLLLSHFPDLTYTGRTALWEFSGEAIAKRPWLGYGFESFWGAAPVVDTLPAFDREWDVRGIVHGHNGYLDIVVTMGFPALIAALFALILVPAKDYMHIPHKRENVFVADLFMMILLFTASNAFLESFFFRRADQVWLFMVMSTFGLRLAARFPMKASPSLSV